MSIMETTIGDKYALSKLINFAASCKATEKMFSLKTSYSTRYSVKQNNGCGNSLAVNWCGHSLRASNSMCYLGFPIIFVIIGNKSL